jgi:hypothetical protein
LVLDSTILENIPMESNHQLNWNITLSDVPGMPDSQQTPFSICTRITAMVLLQMWRKRPASQLSERGW